MLSLEGVRVLSFTHFFQGPFCVQLLADLGADVIKIEPPDGSFERRTSALNAFQNGVSSYHLAVNRNQRSVSVNFKTEEGREFIHRLLENTDVVVQNYRAGVLEKYGLGYEQLKEKYPKLIYCELTGYGPDGPYKDMDMPGHDVIAQGLSGLTSLTGRASEPPVVMGTSVVDATGAILAAYGILGAYIDTLKTGKGHKVDSCLLNAAMNLQIEAYSAFFVNGALHPRLDSGTMSRHYNIPWGAYATKDGYLVLSRVWIPIMGEIFEDERARDITEDDKFTKRELIDEIISKEMKTKTTAEWEKILGEKKCWFARANTYDDVVKDPQVLHNGIIREYEHPVAGKVRVIGNPVSFDGESLPIRRYAPLLGEHTKELLAECGFSPEEIAGMLDNGVVVASDLPGKE